jgi:prevent-host-death family protein
MPNAAIRRTSLATAKAELSRLVDEAEHQGKRIVITRHGKAAAVLVPVSVGMPEKPKPKPMTRKEIDAMWAALAADSGGPNYSAVDDLIAGRRCADSSSTRRSRLRRRASIA